MTELKRAAELMLTRSNGTQGCDADCGIQELVAYFTEHPIKDYRFPFEVMGVRVRRDLDEDGPDAISDEEP